MSAFHQEHVVQKTRKPHRCEWCGGSIEIGSRAASFRGYFEDLYSGYMHLECAAARDAADWVSEDGYESGEQVRGRTDDDRNAGPEFTEADYGNRNQPSK